jgi:epi-isozizaene 5-monooxygenase
MKYPQTPEFPYHWLFGHTRSYYSRPHTFLRTYRDKFGRLFRLNLDGNPHTYAIFDPDCLDALMLKHKEKLDRGSFMQSQQEVWGKGLLISTGALHKQQRAILARAFSPVKMEQYHKTMKTLVREELDQWGDEPSFYPQSAYEKISFRLLIATLFGNQMVDPFTRVAQILRSLTRLYEPHFTQPSFWLKKKLLPFLQTPVLRLMDREEFDRKMNEMKRIFLDEIFPEGRKNKETDSLFSLMLNMRDPQTGERVMSDQQVIDECITFILAGHETVTITLLWCMIVLSRLPQEQQKLQDEIDGIDLRSLSYKDAASMKQTQAFIKETLRCYPTVWTFDRYTREPIQYGEWRFPKGSRLLFSQYVSQRDPKYFNEPDAFRSERWLNGETDNLPLYAYFPFNHGLYGCLGNHFSTMEATVVLSEILSRWSVQPLPFEMEEFGWIVFMLPVPSPQITLKPRS